MTDVFELQIRYLIALAHVNRVNSYYAAELGFS